MTLSRREFVKFAAAAPAATGLMRWVPSADNRCLVVIELVGGNDGLNTVVPIDDDAYGNARPTLSAVRERAVRLADGLAVHEALAPLRRWFDDGHVAVVQGVGYDQPDRSHFRSRDIWHAADPKLVRVGVETYGWLGRAADVLHARAIDVPAIGLGSLEVPLMLQGREVTAPVLRRLSDYSMLVDSRGDEESRRAAMASLVDEAGGAHDDLAEFVRGVAKTGIDNAQRMQSALANARPSADYPEGRFGAAMQLAAKVLLSGFGTRLCHVPLAGFDTHARQAPTHAGLLRQLAGGIAALCTDLDRAGILDQVTLFVHSEFGRRVAENESQGTDHGAAAPVFVIGGGVRGGLHGVAPDLGDLIDGDVRPTMDFRSVYGALVERLGVPRDQVMPAKEVPAPVALF